MTSTPPVQHPFDTIHGLMSWFASEFEADHQAHLSFTLCADCKDANATNNTPCATCRRRLTNGTEDRTRWMNLLRQCITGFYLNTNTTGTYKPLTDPSLQHSLGLFPKNEAEFADEAKKYDVRMAACWAFSIHGDGKLTPELVYVRDAARVKQEWDVWCRWQRITYEFYKEVGWNRVSDAWRYGAGKVYFDGGFKIGEREAEGWIERWKMARDERDGEVR